MPRALPAISHLQFLALGILLTREEPGRVIRQTVARYGVRHTAAAFYQFMARLERDGYVDGWYEQVSVGDQFVKERRYRVTASGRKAWANARAFYETVVASVASGELSNA